MQKKQIKILILTLILQVILSMFQYSPAVIAAEMQSRVLKVSGNKIVLADEPSVVIRLTGLNIPGAEWTGTPGSEKIERSTKEAMENWEANLIRLPVSVEGWYGSYNYVYDGGRGYRNYIDQIITMVSDAGKYVILDLHHYKSFDNQLYSNFWVDAATKYKNNPAVLFGILNEPHGTTWTVWRNGNGSNVKGHQQIVEMIRDLGAKNIIVAGGLDWAYDLRGIAGKASGDPTVYALIDQGSNGDLSKTGNGIVYDTHIYPWKGRTTNWHSAIGDVRKRYPVLVGENGWDAADILAISKKTYYPGDPMYHDKWVPELFAWMNDEATYGNTAHWTGWCFHPSSSPRILGDKDNWSSPNYSYPPTDYWGVYVKSQLKKDLGKNLLLGKTATASASEPGFGPGNAVDDSKSTLWCSADSEDKYLSVDLGENKLIQRWIVRHAGTGTFSSAYNTSDFKLQVSSDMQTWRDADIVVGNTGNITDRFIKPVQGRYVRLYVTKPAQTGQVLRIYEFSAFGIDNPYDFSNLTIFNSGWDLKEVGMLEGDNTTTLTAINSTGTSIEVTLVAALYKRTPGGQDYLYSLSLDNKLVVPKSMAKSSDDYTLTTTINAPNNIEYYMKVLVVDNLTNADNYLAEPILIE